MAHEDSAPPSSVRPHEGRSGGLDSVISRPSLGGSGTVGLVADKMLAAAERIEGSGFHGQIQLAVKCSGRERARVTGMKTQGRGVVSAGMGVSMPGAKESNSDW